MKKLIFIFVFYCSLFITNYSLAQWVWQNMKPIGIPISDFFVFNANTVIAVVSPNTVIKTTDGGLTWNNYSIISNKFNYCDNVYFINSNTGWISGGDYGSHNQFLAKTTNGGINWFSIFPYVSMQLVKFINENTGWVKNPYGFYQNKTLLKTSDGGNNWNVLLTNEQYGAFFNGIDFIDENTGWLIRHTSSPYPDNNEVLKTSDGGISWISYYPGFINPGVRAIKFANSQTGWLSGESGRLRKSTNGGVNWFVQNVDTTINNPVGNLFFADEKTGWVVGDTFIYKTTNGGSNWNRNSIPLNWLGTIKFADLNTAWSFPGSSYCNIIKSTNSGVNWNLLSSGINYSSINKIFFSDQYNGWVVGGRNDYLRTTNGGDDWFLMQTNIPNPHYLNQNDVHFINNNTGWLLNPGQIAKTTNSGNNWTLMFDTSLYNYFINLAFTNDSSCFVLTPHTIFKTSNGGINWTNQILNLGNFNLLKLRFFSGNNGWIIQHDYTSYYMLLKSTDGGLNWIPNFWSLNQINDIYFINQNTGWATANTINNSATPNLIYKTTNGGLNWISYTHPDSIVASFESIYFSDENTGYIVGREYINRTTNGGINWVSRCIFPNWNTSLFFLNGNTGWVSNGRSILKTSDGSLTFNNQENSLIPKSFKLAQNYPNPFNPVTKIRYTIPMRSPTGTFGDDRVVLKVYDILGKEVETLVNEKKSPGKYEVTFNASNYSSGVYFYRLITDGFSKTKKMILLK